MPDYAIPPIAVLRWLRYLLPEDPAGLSASSHSMTCLIAEDNLRMQESIKRFLAGNIPGHHDFYAASNGAEAVALYDRFQPDWVLMDIEMEVMDGLAATRTIMKSHPSARIIILTSYDEAGYRNAAQDAGAAAYVVKNHLEGLRELLTPGGKIEPSAQ